MQVVPFDCPHCGTKNSGFIVSGHYDLPEKDQRAYLLQCSNQQCCGPAIAVSSVHYEFERSTTLAFYPQVKIDIPDHLPENVGKFYRQAENCMPQNPDAAGAMYRKALETGLRQLFPDVGGTLHAKIKSLRKRGDITEALADFADGARLDGNSAVHDDVFTYKQAENLGFFTKMALTYLFTLPNMIAERKAHKEGVNE